jgi:hypothetical protein
MKKILIVVTLGVLCSISGVNLTHAGVILIDENFNIEKMPEDLAYENVLIGFHKDIAKKIARVNVTSKYGISRQGINYGTRTVIYGTRTGRLWYSIGRFEPGDDVQVEVKDYQDNVISYFSFKVKEKKHYTFRLGKIRIRDTDNSQSIDKDIRDVLLIRFLIPARVVDEEHPFYPSEKGIRKWFKRHLDFHIGLTQQKEPTIFLIGVNIEINKFVDVVGGIALSNDPKYRRDMYYYGITFDSKLFHHIVDMIQQTIKMAEK